MSAPMNGQRSWLQLVDAAVAEQTTSAWPTPITFRLPAPFDGDRNHNIQVLTSEGWQLCHWQGMLYPGMGWQHTLIWQPRSTVEQQLISELGELHRIESELKRLLSEFRAALI